MAHLIPCTDCARHVQATDAVCPFCGAALSNADATRMPLPPRGVSRAAALAFGATLVVACSGGTGGVGDAGTTDDGSTNNTSSGSSAYGGPPIDSGTPKDSGPTDDGGTSAAYGLPPTDSGVDSGGGS